MRRMAQVAEMAEEAGEPGTAQSGRSGRKGPGGRRVRISHELSGAAAPGGPRPAGVQVNGQEGFDARPEARARSDHRRGRMKIEVHHRATGQVPSWRMVRGLKPRRQQRIASQVSPNFLMHVRGSKPGPGGFRTFPGLGRASPGLPKVITLVFLSQSTLETLASFENMYPPMVCPGGPPHGFVPRRDPRRWLTSENGVRTCAKTACHA